ncbi:MAG: pyruvoyl-dependent arginine decarboxylase [Defluviitaleaceae bacterium]|nr:pyruvoyl-dependent arginine decarboxylase [Defluviitaleaceae bacterium]
MFEKNKFYLFTGFSKNIQEKLVGFDAALHNAGMGNYNLVKVSSILPPNFESEDMIDVEHGNVVFTAFTHSSEKGKGKISAAVGVGVPVDKDKIGVIMECSCNDSKDIAEKKVQNMVLAAMKQRNIEVKDVLLVSVEVELGFEFYSTVLAGVALW